MSSQTLPDGTRADADTRAFVAYSREDEIFVAHVVSRLRARGISVWLDRDIAPGQEWPRVIEDCLRDCTHVLIVLSRAAVASHEVRGELRIAAMLRKSLIPIRLEACELPRELRDVQLLRVDDVSRDYEAITERIISAIRATSTKTRNKRRSHRRSFLDLLNSEIAGRLRQSIRGDPLEIPKILVPDLVTRRWDSFVPVREPVTIDVEPQGGIVDVYDSLQGQLLILGAPGSGKTTALLELGRTLCARAINDPVARMPVLCSVSTWRPRQPFEVWLAEQLELNYGIRKDIAQRWWVNGRLVPLLDGLDERGADALDYYVRAINALSDVHQLPQVVVCARYEEYTSAHETLRLRGALRLLSLQAEQIGEYLKRAGCLHLWPWLQANAEANAFARSPLLLRILTVSHTATSVSQKEPPRSEWLLEPQLFDSYVDRALRDKSSYPPLRAVRWLGWVADTMIVRGSSELTIEQLQPTLLRSVPARAAYRTCTLVSYSVLSFAALVVCAIAVNLPLEQTDLTRHLRSAAMGPAQYAGFIQVFATALSMGIALACLQKIRFMEVLSWSPRRAWEGIRDGLRTYCPLVMNYTAYFAMLFGLVVTAFNITDLLEMPLTISKMQPSRLLGDVIGAVALLGLSKAQWQSSPPRTWLSSGLRPPAGQMLSVIAASMVLGGAAATSEGLSYGASAAIGMALMLVRGSRADCWWAAILARWLLLAPIGAVCCGSILRVLRGGALTPLSWISGWLLAGIGTAAMIVCTQLLLRQLSSPRSANSSDTPPIRDRRRLWIRALQVLCAAILVGLIMAYSPDRSVTQSLSVGIWRMLRRAGISVYWGLGTACVLMIALAAMATALVAFAAAFVGLLRGLTAPEVANRSRFTQPVRHALMNTWRCAIAAGIVVGLPFAFANIAVLLVGAVPMALPAFTWRDLFSVIAGSTTFVGTVGFLIPLGACIQHGSLRLVLAYVGDAPLRYTRFLDYATDRKLLQRIGGRYRFIHELVRDHFATSAPEKARQVPFEGPAGGAKAE